MKAIVVAALIFSSAVIADPETRQKAVPKGECTGNWCNGLVETVYVHSLQNAVFVMMEGNENDLLCSPVEGKMLKLSADTPLFREMFEALLQANIHGKRVIARTTTTKDTCEIIYVQTHVL